MLAAIADTHTILWYLFSDPRLGRAAFDFFEAAIANEALPQTNEVYFSRHFASDGSM